MWLQVSESLIQFIKQQDKLFREEQATKLAGMSSVRSSLVFAMRALNKVDQSNFEEAEASYRTQIRIVQEELARAKVGNVSSLFC